MDSTSELFKRLQNSDEKAYEKLFSIYFNKMTCFITSILKDGEAASDLAQDLFLKLWESRATLCIGGDVDTYLFVMAKNKAIDFLRRKNLEENLLVGSINSLYEDSVSPESAYCAKDSLEHIERIIEEMPVQRKTIFRMSRFHGLSYKEIAKELDVAVKTVESHIYCALRQIGGKINR